MKLKFRIKDEHSRDDSLYYHIGYVVIDEKDGDMVKVHDVDDGHEFWIDVKKLEIV